MAPGMDAPGGNECTAGSDSCPRVTAATSSPSTSTWPRWRPLLRQCETISRALARAAPRALRQVGPAFAPAAEVAAPRRLSWAVYAGSGTRSEAAMTGASVTSVRRPVGGT